MAPFEMPTIWMCSVETWSTRKYIGQSSEFPSCVDGHLIDYCNIDTVVL